MKTANILAFPAIAMAMCVSAAAEDLPLRGIYGNASGCEVATDGGYPEAGMVAILPNAVFYDGARCPITGFTPAEAEAGVEAWNVNIACEFGHDEVSYGNLLVTQQGLGEPDAESDAGQPSITVARTSGIGPQGDYPFCEQSEN